MGLLHEIREYAHAIRRIVAKTHPRLFGRMKPWPMVEPQDPGDDS